MVGTTRNAPNPDGNSPADVVLRVLHELHRRFQTDQLASLLSVCANTTSVHDACRVMPFGEFCRLVNAMSPRLREEYEQELRGGYDAAVALRVGEDTALTSDLPSPLRHREQPAHPIEKTSLSDEDIAARLRASAHRLRDFGR